MNLTVMAFLLREAVKTEDEEGHRFHKYPDWSSTSVSNRQNHFTLIYLEEIVASRIVNGI
jgi:hypothetical protein